jgi:hypothetical protein
MRRQDEENGVAVCFAPRRRWTVTGGGGERAPDEWHDAEASAIVLEDVGISAVIDLDQRDGAEPPAASELGPRVGAQVSHPRGHAERRNEPFLPVVSQPGDGHGAAQAGAPTSGAEQDERSHRHTPPE